jgi:polyisoprenoid-binding protein YceI
MAKFVIDPDHSAAGFTVRHMMVSWVHGQFTKVAGTFNFDPKDMSSLFIEAEIDVASIHTGVEKRDEDLRSPNYFDARKYPKIIFRSARTEQVALDSCVVYGDLAVHGVTRLVALDVRFAGPSQFQDDEKLYTTYGFSGKTMVNRENFGMVTNMPIEAGGFMVGKYAYLTINAEVDLVEE